jgi:hypothetical protein
MLRGRLDFGAGRVSDQGLLLLLFLTGESRRERRGVRLFLPIFFFLHHRFLLPTSPLSIHRSCSDSLLLRLCSLSLLESCRLANFRAIAPSILNLPLRRPGLLLVRLRQKLLPATRV